MSSSANQLPDSIWRRTLFAMAAALTVNIVLYYGGLLLLPDGYLVRQAPGMPFEPLPFAMVVFVTALTMIIGAVVYWLFNAFISETPNTTFTIIVVLVLVLSFAGPFTMAAGIITQIILSLMHIVTAVSLTWFLTR